MIPLIKRGVKLGKARLAEVVWEDPREQSVYAVEGKLVLLEMLKMLEQLNVSDEIKRLLKQIGAICGSKPNALCKSGRGN